MQRIPFFGPLIWPVFSFLLAILVGASLLRLPFCQTEGTVSFLDCAFLATSAVCVTGLASVDIATQLSQPGHLVILLLMQVGGLGITTYTSLMFVALKKRIPLNDRLALAQGFDKEKVDIKVVIMQVIALALCIQCCAALGLYWHDPVRFHPFSAFFHAASAFCNAGFSLFPGDMPIAGALPMRCPPRWIPSMRDGHLCYACRLRSSPCKERILHCRISRV